MIAQVFWYWLPVALYAGAIFFWSSQSHPEEQLPSRESSWLDWLADTAGAAIGVLSWQFLRSE